MTLTFIIARVAERRADIAHGLPELAPVRRTASVKLTDWQLEKLNLDTRDSGFGPAEEIAEVFVEGASK